LTKKCAGDSTAIGHTGRFRDLIRGFAAIRRQQAADPTSTVLRNCASDQSKFFMLTRSTQIATTCTANGAEPAPRGAVIAGHIPARRKKSPAVTAGLLFSQTAREISWWQPG
jgi:hypothetical protein